MKKFFLLVLLAAGLYGCKDDPQDGVKLVSNVVMPTDKTFGPGAEVIVTAQGFVTGDGVMIRRGAVIRDAEVLEVEPTQIRFIVPSGFPAGSADVLLTRGKNKYMVLGKIALLDGRAPEDYSLYGISRKDGRTQIDSIMVRSGHIIPFATLAAGEDITGAVNAIATNNLYGVYDGRAVQFNLTTKRYRDSGVTNVLAMGTLGTGTPAYLLKLDENRVRINNTGLTRAIAQPSLTWELPAEVTPQMLAGTPFVSTSDNCLLLVAKTGEGRYLPVVLEMAAPFRARTGDAITADGVVPFRAALVLDGSVTPSLVGGLAVAQDGQTILKTFIPSSLTYSQEIGRVPGVVQSCTAWITGDGTERFFLLSQVDEKRVVSRYVLKKTNEGEYTGELTTLVEDAPFTEIVLAR